MTDGNPNSVSANPEFRGPANRSPVTAELLKAVSLLAREVARLHEQGRLHLQITSDNVVWDDQGRLVLPPSGDGVSFGGRFADEELCPVPLRQQVVIRIPSEIPAAQAALKRAGASIPPESIDTYQLAALLCWLITKQPISSYCRSPKTKSQIPLGIQPILDRALSEQVESGDFTPTQFAKELDEQAAALSDSANVKEASTEDTAPSLPSSQAESDTSPGNPARNSSSEGSLPFETLGHYQIRKRIGQGGMGDVFQAYEPSLDRIVAIKTLPTELARSEEFVQRFYSEATSAARLIHQNITQIYYIGEDQNHHFFAMQYIDGESLSDRLNREGRLSEEATLDIIEQSLAGLQAAHEMGLVHRDIKPGNILLDSKSHRVYLADFGLVKSLAQKDGLTATGMVMGTVDYISPEQGRGQEVDARADLYSLGVVIYRMLSGRLPFQADSPTAMIFQHVYEPPPSLKQQCPALSAVYSQIVAKLLAKSPSDRYASASDVLSDLDAARRSEPLPSGADVICLEPSSVLTKPSPDVSAVSGQEPTVIIQAPDFDGEPLVGKSLSRSSRWWTRLRTYAVGLFSKRAPNLYESLQNTQQLVEGAIQEYERRQRELQNVSQEANQVLQGLHAQIEEWELAVHQTADPDEKKRFQTALVELQTQAVQQQEQFDEIQLQLHRINGQLEGVRNQRDVLNARLKVAQARISVAGGQVRERTLASRFAEYIQAHPLQTILPAVVVALAATFGILALVKESEKTFPQLPSPTAGEPEVNPLSTKPKNVFDVANYPHIKARLPLRQFQGHEGEIYALEFTPDSRVLASGSADKSVRLWNVETGSTTQTITPQFNSNLGFSVGYLAANPEEPLLGVGGRVRGGAFKTNQIWNLATGELDSALPFPGGDTEQLTWSKDGKHLVVIFRKGAEVGIAVSARQAISVPHTATVPFRGGSRLALSRHGNAVAQVEGSLDLLSGTETKLKVQLIRVGEKELLGEAFELKAEHSLDMFPLTESEKQKTLRGNYDPGTARINRVALSPDGNWAATVITGQGVILLWNLKDRVLAKTFVGMEARIRQLRFSPDGRRLCVAAYPEEDSNFDSIYLWEVQTGHLRARMQSHPLKQLAMSPNGIYLVTGGASQIMLFDAAVQGLEVSPNRQALKNANVLSMSRSGRYLATANDQLNLWRITDSLDAGSFPESGGVRLIEFSPNEDWIVTGHDSGKLMVRSMSRRIKLRETNIRAFSSKGTRPNDISDIAFTPDNEHVLVATREDVLLWNISNGSETRQFLDGVTEVESVEISPDGKVIAVLGKHPVDGNTNVTIWDYKTRELIHRLPPFDENYYSIAFSEEGRLVGGAKGKCTIWNVETGQQLGAIFPRKNGADPSLWNVGIGHVAFVNKDAELVLVADSTIVLWDLKFDEEIIRYELDRKQGALRCFAVSADGQKIATTQRSGVTHLWDIRKGF